MDGERVAKVVKAGETPGRRVNARSDKRTVLGKAMVSYAKFGPLSPFTDKLSATIDGTQDGSGIALRALVVGGFHFVH